MGAVAAAHREAGAVFQDHGTIPVGQWGQLADPVHFDNGGPVDTHKRRRIELPFELGDGASNQELARADVQGHVVVSRPNPVDLGEVDDQQPVVDSRRKAREEATLLGQSVEECRQARVPGGAPAASRSRTWHA